MTPRCPLCGGVVVGAHFHGVDPEQRCSACDAEREAYGQPVCACSLADLRSALEDRDAAWWEAVRDAEGTGVADDCKAAVRVNCQCAAVLAAARKGGAK